jgi:hypothetical protein
VVGGFFLKGLTRPESEKLRVAIPLSDRNGLAATDTFSAVARPSGGNHVRSSLAKAVAIVAGRK